MNAAKKLFYSKGLDNTTMDEIAEEAELSKGTLYLYFQSKEILALSIIKETSDLLNGILKDAAATEKPGIERIADITEVLTDFFKANRDEFRFLKHMDNLTASLGTGNDILKEWKSGIEDLIRVVLDIVADGIRDGSIREDIEPDKAAFIYSNMVISLLIRLASHQGIILMNQSLSEDDIIETMFRMILKMLEPRQTPEKSS